VQERLKTAKRHPVKKEPSPQQKRTSGLYLRGEKWMTLVREDPFAPQKRPSKLSSQKKGLLSFSALLFFLGGGRRSGEGGCG